MLKNIEDEKAGVRGTGGGPDYGQILEQYYEKKLRRQYDDNGK